jgi:alanine racemase
VPLVGRVSMDAVVADVTDVPGGAVDETDEFVLLGRQGDAAIIVDLLERVDHLQAELARLRGARP